jgi:uncharacterized protein
MEAFYFGLAGRRLFGCHHPSALMPARQSVLICGPYGQELVRAHRMLRVLAERLARLGCDVLRFDPFGSGDSAGDDEALDWPGWVADIRTAADELRRRSRATRQVWVGARLGGTAACAAAGQAGPPPDALVLCEPVIDGPAYLQSLALATVEALEASCSIRDPEWRRGLQTDRTRWEREAVGFAMSAALHQTLQSLDLAAQRFPVPLPLILLSSGGSSQASQAAQLAERWRALGLAARHEVVPFTFDWTAEEALNTALVPHEMLQRLVELASTALEARP